MTVSTSGGSVRAIVELLSALINYGRGALHGMDRVVAAPARMTATGVRALERHAVGLAPAEAADRTPAEAGRTSARLAGTAAHQPAREGSAPASPPFASASAGAPSSSSNAKEAPGTP